MDPTTPAEQILLGDEAVARGAIDAGISAAYAYPGTPSTEIFQTIQAQARALGLPVQGLWSANEKVALEEGVGVSYAGRRALVAMKHVGLNVAADPFMNVAVSGTPFRSIRCRARKTGPGSHTASRRENRRRWSKVC